MTQFLSKEFLLFLLTGGLAAAVNFGSRILLNNVMSYSAAIVCAYLIGMVTAFVLAKFLVFRNSQQSFKKSAGLFIAVNLIAVAQTWVVSMSLFNYVLPKLGITQFAKEIAHAVGVAIPVFTSYVGHKHWSFKA